MRSLSPFGLATADSTSSLSIWPLLSLLLPLTQAQGASYTPVPLPALDLSQLGRVALAGDFDSISLYTYEEQNENPFNSNGSQLLLTQESSGAIGQLVAADASITSMCPFVMHDGTLAGVVIGGNFTSFGGSQAQGITMFAPPTNEIIPLPGLSGSVATVYCDQETNTVYVGGNFKGGNSTNAIAWVGTAGWTDLPFAGFNGPVTTISKSSDGNILFGGSFTGLGNTTTPNIPNQQVVNLASAQISAVSTSGQNGFSDPSNIVCNNGGQSSPGNTWLVADGVPGTWKAEMQFGYRPTKLRLWNTNYEGRGTQTFRFTAFPINGILNLTYVDPTTGNLTSCDSQCPLQTDPTIAQDFNFVNVIGMDAFQIDISAWYGAGAGLNGIELFQDDIYAYAVSSFDEPTCEVSQLGSNATTTGPWTVTPSGVSNSEYLTANLVGPGVDSTSASVVFQPDIRQSGNYLVTMYTPGCQDNGNTCSQRGIVQVSASFASGPQVQAPPPTQVYQTNENDKYDQIYNGYVDAGSSAFRPTVTITPIPGQNSSISIVAQRVRFQLLDTSSSGLNGLFEYDPNNATAQTDFSASAFDIAGNSLPPQALISSISVFSGTVYVAGNFSANGFENIFSIGNGNATALPSGGLNAPVTTAFQYGNLLFLGGNFTGTSQSGTEGLNHVAVYDTAQSTWLALGAGVNGPVNTIVPLLLNITGGPETCITINGDFSQILSFSSNQGFSTSSGLAVWVPSQNNWLHNLNVATEALTGQLSAATNVTGSTPLLAGTLASRGMAISDGAELSTSGTLTLGTLGLQIQPPASSSSGLSKRDVTQQTISGALAGLWDTDSGRNMSIIGGHFSATATNGSTINNLAIVNYNSSGVTSITGITSNSINSSSVFQALAIQSNLLYAGGSVSGNVSRAAIEGVIVWDLNTGDFASAQVPPLQGANVVVNAITVQPNTANVFVAGQFDSAGSLPCPNICAFEGGRWTQAGAGVEGSISSLTWQGTSILLVGGNMTVGGNKTSLATYDVTTNIWMTFNNAPTAIPGPVSALTPANGDASHFWLGGQSTNGSSFLIMYDGTNFNSVGNVLGTQTEIQGLSMLSLSQQHSENNLVPNNMALLLTGQLNLPGFGNASAALFNGTTFSPFILSNSGNNPGTLSQIFTEKPNTFSPPGGTLKVIFVVLIALACALSCIFLLVVAGMIIERRRRRKEGYRPAPTNYFEKSSNVDRVPPEELFGRLNQEQGARHFLQ